MTTAVPHATVAPVAVRDVGPTPVVDVQRRFQLALAVVWLVDGVLQFQPFMFTPGSAGFSGMLRGLAAGNPGFVARSIAWNATLVNHHPVALNSVFACLQIVIALGIAYRPTRKLALGASVVWSVAVWWFGEGLGGVLTGAATPLGGGPGAVLFYALLGVLLWPREPRGAQPPFVAAQTVGTRAARVVWTIVWLGLGALFVVGHGRSSQDLHDLVATMNSGEPGWLSTLDRHTESFLLLHGSALVVTLAVVCVFLAVAVYAGPTVARIAVAVAVVLFALVWVTTENFGGILIGGATDPNSGPVVVLFALAYWPLRRAAPSTTPSVGVA